VTLSDLLFCGFSLLGLFLVPASLGRRAWTLPAAFGALGLYLYVAPASLHPGGNPWIALALSQGPGILLLFDLMARGRVAREIDPVPLRELLAFSLVHLTFLRHMVSAARGDLPLLFAFEAAFSGVLLSAGALLLWALHPRRDRPLRAWYRALVMVWNTWGLLGVLEFGFRVQRAAPDFPFAAWARPSRELHAYFTGWPGALDAFFWVPLAASIHLAIFYRLFKRTSGALHAPASVSST
jgi:hypothetical protein